MIFSGRRGSFEIEVQGTHFDYFFGCPGEGPDRGPGTLIFSERRGSFEIEVQGVHFDYFFGDPGESPDRGPRTQSNEENEEKKKVGRGDWAVRGLYSRACESHGMCSRVCDRQEAVRKTSKHL